MNMGDLFKFMAFGQQIAGAVGSVESFNEDLDAATVGDEVTLDIPDDHEPLYPLRLKGNHKARVASITFHKVS